MDGPFDKAPFRSSSPYVYLHYSRPSPMPQAACLFCEIDCRLPALSRTAFSWLAENLPPRISR